MYMQHRNLFLTVILSLYVLVVSIDIGTTHVTQEIINNGYFMLIRRRLCTRVSRVVLSRTRCNKHAGEEEDSSFFGNHGTLLFNGLAIAKALTNNFHCMYMYTPFYVSISLSISRSNH